MKSAAPYALLSCASQDGRLKGTFFQRYYPQGTPGEDRRPWGTRKPHPQDGAQPSLEPSRALQAGWEQQKWADGPCPCPLGWVPVFRGDGPHQPQRGWDVVGTRRQSPEAARPLGPLPHWFVAYPGARGPRVPVWESSASSGHEGGPPVSGSGRDHRAVQLHGTGAIWTSSEGWAGSFGMLNTLHTHR